MIIGYIWLWQIIEQILKSPTEGALYFLNSLRAGLRRLCSLNWTSRVSYPPQCSQHVCLRLSHKLGEPESSSCWVNFNHSYSECESSGTLLMLHHFFPASLCLIIELTAFVQQPMIEAELWVIFTRNDWCCAFCQKVYQARLDSLLYAKPLLHQVVLYNKFLTLKLFFFNAPPQWRM